MEFELFTEEPYVVAIITGVSTFIVLLLAYVYTRHWHHQQHPSNKSKTSSQQVHEQSQENEPELESTSKSTREWKTQAESAKVEKTLDKMKAEHGKGFDESDVKTILGGFGGCPVFHGMPKFHDVGKGSWPPGGSDNTDEGGKGEGTEADPMDFCQHIPGQVKRTQQRVAIKKLEEEMSEEQKINEREVQRKQLEEIFRLMEEQKDKFGVSSLGDVQDQMRLYAQ